jgi:hypothetical protein
MSLDIPAGSSENSRARRRHHLPCWFGHLASDPGEQFQTLQLRRISVKHLQVSFRRLAVAGLAIAMAAWQSAHAQTLTVLYSFTGAADGGYPESGVTLDGAGNVYGTTEFRLGQFQLFRLRSRIQGKRRWQ